MIGYQNLLYGLKETQVKDYDIAGILLIIFISLVVILINVLPVLNVEHYTGTVVDKYQKATFSNDTGKDRFYVVVDVSNDSRVVFVNEDEFFKWKFNSADVQASLEVGKHYEITTVGWRIPFLSMFKNIIKVTPVKENNVKQYPISPTLLAIWLR